MPSVSHESDATSLRTSRHAKGRKPLLLPCEVLKEAVGDVTSMSTRFTRYLPRSVLMTPLLRSFGALF